MTGLSAFIALWKTIETLRHRKRRSFCVRQADDVVAAEADAARRSAPPAAQDLRIAFAIVLLPQPDSPARPTISPAWIVEVDVVDGAHGPPGRA